MGVESACGPNREMLCELCVRKMGISDTDLRGQISVLFSSLLFCSGFWPVGGVPEWDLRGQIRVLLRFGSGFWPVGGVLEWDLGAQAGRLAEVV